MQTHHYRHRLLAWFSLFLLSLTLNAFADTTIKALASLSLTVQNQTFVTEVATNDKTRAQGLSDREALALDHAMLFSFATASDASHPLTFWMIRMHFPLDILWLDSDKHVLSIIAEAEPCIGSMACNLNTPITDHDHCLPGLAQKQCPLLAAPIGTRYALEMPADTAKKLNIVAGTPVAFDLSTIK